jgi:hypothetical protein
VNALARLEGFPQAWSNGAWLLTRRRLHPIEMRLPHPRHGGPVATGRQSDSMPDLVRHPLHPEDYAQIARQPRDAEQEFAGT